jgi:hypothetical protein
VGAIVRLQTLSTSPTPRLSDSPPLSLVISQFAKTLKYHATRASSKLTRGWLWHSIWLMSLRPLQYAGYVVVLTALILFGCGKPFNVKPRVDPLTGPVSAGVQADGVEVQAAAVLDEDYLEDTFDANLVMAGILPVRILVQNMSGQAIALKTSEFEVVGAGGRKYKELSARRAFKHLARYYGLRAYSKFGFKQSFEAFSSYALDRSVALAPAQPGNGAPMPPQSGSSIPARNQPGVDAQAVAQSSSGATAAAPPGRRTLAPQAAGGMLFFEVAADTARGPGLRLVVKRLGSSRGDAAKKVELKLS